MRRTAPLLPSICCLSLAIVSGCGQDAFTYAEDAKAEGMRLYQKGDYTNAAAAFNNAARQAPRDYQALYYLGSSYQATQSYQQAIAAYRSEQAVQPMTLAGQQDAALRYQTMDNLARCVATSKTGVDDEVAAVRKRAAIFGPNVDDQWYLAKVYRYSQDPDDAIEAYNKALLIDGGRFDIAKEAGLYEEQVQQTKQAVDALRKAWVVNPNDEQVNDALRRLGQVPGPSLQNASDLSHI